jgi:hypothetical protein
MKRKFLLTIAVVVALCGAATDRFYIEDFTISPGESRTVSILLDNETAYTAFQSDVYLPEGLTATNFALTNRKSNNHSFTATVLPDGGIRLLCYSLQLKTFSGNSGALVDMVVTASEDFEAPATVLVKNSLFTTVQGVEVPFSDETCTVTLPTAVLLGDVNEDKIVDIDDVTMLINVVLGNILSGYNAVNANVNVDSLLDIDDVTALIKKILGIQS